MSKVVLQQYLNRTSLTFYPMNPRYRGYGRISITMPAYILRRIDNLAKDVELSRSEVITDLCRYCLENEEVIDEIYPYEEEVEEGDEEGY